MKKNVVAIIVLMIMILALSTNVVFADKATIGKTVNATTVRLRKEANTSCDTLKLLGANTKVEVVDEEGDWYKVYYDNILGYISKQYIEIVEQGEFIPNGSSSSSKPETPAPTSPSVEPDTPAQTEPEAPASSEPSASTTEPEKPTETEIQKEKEFNLEKETDVRNVPSFSSKTVTSIANGTKVTLIVRLGNWVKVTDGNVTGWIVKMKPTVATNSANGSQSSDNDSTQSGDNNSNQTGDTNTKIPDNTASNNQSDDNGSQSSENNSGFPRSGKTNTDSVRIRASKDGRVYALLKPDTKVEVIGEDDTWYIVNYNEYKKAYIAKSLIDLE